MARSAGVVVAVLMAVILSACAAPAGGSRAPIYSAPTRSSGTQSAQRTPVPLQGSAGTFHIRDVDGYTFDLVYSYQPSRVKTRPLVMASSHMAEVQVEAQYGLEVVNTTPDRVLSFKRSSIWAATFGLYAFWNSPNPICDGILGPGRSGYWCAVELAHFHVDQDIPPGGSVQLSAHPGFSDSYPVDAGTLAPNPSDVLAIRDALARPDDFVIGYDGGDGLRFTGSCTSEGAPRPLQSEDRSGGSGIRMSIAARSGTCRAFQDKSIFPTDAEYVNPGDQFTFLD